MYVNIDGVKPFREKYSRGRRLGVGEVTVINRVAKDVLSGEGPEEGCRGQQVPNPEAVTSCLPAAGSPVRLE